MKFELDEFDIKILDIVQRDNRVSTEIIADKVNLSPSAVQRRLKRLRQAKVIEADRSIISPEAVGQKLTAIVEITMNNEQSDIFESFKQLILNAPEVLQCYYVAGSADFILVMTAGDVQEYDNFARRNFMDNPHVKRYQTNIVMQRIKSASIIPLRACS